MVFRTFSPPPPIERRESGGVGATVVIEKHMPDNNEEMKVLSKTLTRSEGIDKLVLWKTPPRHNIRDMPGQNGLEDTAGPSGLMPKGWCTLARAQRTVANTDHE